MIKVGYTPQVFLFLLLLHTFSIVSTATLSVSTATLSDDIPTSSTKVNVKIQHHENVTSINKSQHTLNIRTLFFACHSNERFLNLHHERHIREACSYHHRHQNNTKHQLMHSHRSFGRPYNKNTQTTSQYYNLNTNRNDTRNTVVNVLLGALASICMLLGLLFFMDQEAFHKVVEATGIPSVLTTAYSRCRSCRCTCRKPIIDPEDGDDTDSINKIDILSMKSSLSAEQYLTPSTVEYLTEKRDREVEKPRRLFWSIFQSCLGTTKQYDDSDKYRIQPPHSSDDDDRRGGSLSAKVWDGVEYIRLRLCWKPAKVYDESDKYRLGKDDDRGDNINMNDNSNIIHDYSSYESASVSTVPWT